MQITCPGCKTKLQLADTTAPGSKVQCPNCKKLMVLPAASPNAKGGNPAPAAGKPPANKPPAPAAKVPAKPAPAAQAPAITPGAKPTIDEDDDGPNSYGVVHDPDMDDEDDEEEEEEEAPVKSSKGKNKGQKDDAPAKPKRKKPKINYAPDMSVKDLRGPAMIQVVPPSNYLMIQCGVVMMTAVFSIAQAVWPFMFQERILTPAAALRDHFRELQGKGGQEGKSAGQRWDRIDKGYITWPKKNKKDDDQGFSGEDMKDDELRAAEEAIRKQMPFAVAWVVVSVLILAYSVAVAFGAVKMQSLESYPWALTGSILAMLPFNGIALLVYYFKPMNFSEDMPWVLLAIACEGIFFFLIGLLCLAVLLKKEVKTGFYYRSDAIG